MKTYKVIIIDLDHRCIGASTKALHLEEGEQSVLRRFTVLDTQLLLNGLHDLFTTAQHTRSSATELNKELANLLTRHEKNTKTSYVLYME